MRLWTCRAGPGIEYNVCERMGAVKSETFSIISRNIHAIGLAGD
jgi:hypothetical protein